MLIYKSDTWEVEVLNLVEVRFKKGVNVYNSQTYGLDKESAVKRALNDYGHLKSSSPSFGEVVASLQNIKIDENVPCDIETALVESKFIAESLSKVDRPSDIVSKEFKIHKLKKNGEPFQYVLGTLTATTPQEAISAWLQLNKVDYNVIAIPVKKG